METRATDSRPPGTLLLGRLQIDFWQQWTEWFSGHWNWKNFTLIEISYEWELYCKGHELSLVILGLHCRLTWWYSKDFYKSGDSDSASTTQERT